MIHMLLFYIFIHFYIHFIIFCIFVNVKSINYILRITFRMYAFQAGGLISRIRRSIYRAKLPQRYMRPTT